MATLDFAISFPLVRGDSVGVGRFHSQPNRGSDLRPRRRAFEKPALAADGKAARRPAASVRHRLRDGQYPWPGGREGIQASPL